MLSEELKDKELPLMSLYDMSKQIVRNLPARTTAAELEPLKKILRKFKKLGYFMLMCREDNYYTVLRVRKTKNPDQKEDDVKMFKLFAYNWGVVECC